MSVFSDILVSKVSEEVSHDWTVRTLKVEKVKIPTHVTNVHIMGVMGYVYQLPIYWPITFARMAFLRDSLPFFLPFHHYMDTTIHKITWALFHPPL